VAAVLALLKLVLNPMNWAKLWGLVQGLLSLFDGVRKWIRDWAQRKDREKAKEAIDKIEEAQKEPDDEKRVEAVADATCELEKALFPGSDCDAKPGNR
jgi:hypothetical protein